MNKGVAITLIVILSIVALAITGGFIYLLTNNFEFGSFDFNSFSTKLVAAETYDSAEEINIDSKAIDVFVEETDDNQIKFEIYSDKNVDYNFSNEDGVINVKAHNQAVVFNFLSKSPKVLVKLPKEYAAKFTIDAKVGDVHVGSFANLRPTIKNTTGDLKINLVDEATLDLNVGDIHVEKANVLNIKKGTGDVKVQDVETINVTSSVGDIKIQNVTNKVNITNTTGDIKIQTANINEESNISNKTGDIKISVLSGAYIEATNNVGDIKVNNNDRKLELTCTIHTNTGDIRVN